MGKLENWIWVVIVAGLAGFIAWRAFRPPAPTPGVFVQDVRLNDALAQSKDTGRPVLALATADWCPPCQALKRGALADDRVVALIGERAIPVYVDVDQHPDEARMLGAASIPASYVIRDGQITAQITGALGAQDYLAWLEDNLGG